MDPSPIIMVRKNKCDKNVDPIKDVIFVQSLTNPNPIPLYMNSTKKGNKICMGLLKIMHTYANTLSP